MVDNCMKNLMKIRERLIKECSEMFDDLGRMLAQETWMSMSLRS